MDRVFHSSGFLLIMAYQTIGAAQVRAQDADVEVPAVTPADFSQIVGKKYEISSSAAPTEVLVEEPIILKVQISGQGPQKYRPERKNLHIFPEDVADDFHVEALTDQDKHQPGKGLWEFVYRLRPKRADVSRIPELQLKYFVPESKRFQSSFADEIVIKVTPRQPVTAEKLKLKVVQAPARFYQLRPAEEVARDDTPMPAPSPELALAILALPPLACLVWYRVWRRLYPNAAELRLRRRSRAARLAVAYLTKHAPDVPRTRAAAVDFLRQRLDLPAVEATPREVARHLKRMGLAKPLALEWSVFLGDCDRFRFARPADALPADQPENPLCGEAIRLIHALEADPCVAR
jgi:hypothetical protein